MKRSIPTIQNGTAATSTAVRPLGIVCSAHTTAPLPKPMSRNPISARDGHVCREGSRSPVSARAARIIAPAIVHRNPPISIGGIVCSATRMAR
jgi:hypothetical protein